jgi:phosphoglycolate phosphatase-like HAD superfamily hydrolase
MTVHDAHLEDAALAARHQPILVLDDTEPYEPLYLGFSLFRGPGQSPSSKFPVVPQGEFCIEYAVWYDWDIGHLYDLEHVWVHVDRTGNVLAVEASRHGKRLPMIVGGTLPELRDGHPVLYPEAGKHAHWAHPDQMSGEDRRQLKALCGPLAGMEGVHEGGPFVAGRYTATPFDHRLARLKMRHDAFMPTWQHRRVASPALLPWAQLDVIIPERMREAMATLPATVPHLAAIFLDCGDTLIDERTEHKAPGSEVVLSGDLIPGARSMVAALKAAGHRLVLVADGPRQSFVNLLGQHGLWDHFDAHIISEDIGALKPDARMFDAALAAMSLTRGDARHVVMVGNNLERDIRGANALGITSVLMAWSTLRARHAATGADHPDYRIPSPRELPVLIDSIELALRYREPAFFSPLVSTD